MPKLQTRTESAPSGAQLWLPAACAAALVVLRLLLAPDGKGAAAAALAAVAALALGLVLRRLPLRGWLRASWPWLYGLPLGCCVLSALPIYDTRIAGAALMLLVFPLAYHASRYQRFDGRYVVRVVLLGLLGTFAAMLVAGFSGKGMPSPVRLFVLLFAALLLGLRVRRERRSTVPGSRYVFWLVSFAVYFLIMILLYRSGVLMRGMEARASDAAAWRGAVAAVLQNAKWFGASDFLLPTGEQAAAAFAPSGAPSTVWLLLRLGKGAFAAAAVLCFTLAVQLNRWADRTENSFSRYVIGGVSALYLARLLLAGADLFLLLSGSEALPFLGSIPDLAADVLLLGAAAALAGKDHEETEGLALDEDYTLAEKHLSRLERLMRLELAVMEDFDDDEDDEALSALRGEKLARRREMDETLRDLRAGDPTCREDAARYAEAWRQEQAARSERDEVFISLQRRDLPFARVLAAQLKRAGVPCWHYGMHRDTGIYSDVLAKHIEHAAIMIVLIGEETNGSRGVLRELHDADHYLDSGLRMLPVRLADVQLTGGVGHMLGPEVMLDVHDLPPQEQAARVVRAVLTIRSETGEA